MEVVNETDNSVFDWSKLYARQNMNISNILMKIEFAAKNDVKIEAHKQNSIWHIFPFQDILGKLITLVKIYKHE